MDQRARIATWPASPLAPAPTRHPACHGVRSAAIERRLVQCVAVGHEQDYYNPSLSSPLYVCLDIRALEFARLRDAGIKGIVFDKDNCLTLPYEDALHAPLSVRRALFQ